MATPKSGQSASSSAPKASGAPSTGSSLRDWGGRVLNLMRPNFGKDSPGKSGSSRITKLIFGTLIFVLVGQLLVTGLQLLNSAYKLGLNAPVFTGAPWLTWFFAIYFLLLIGLWFGLNYLGFFPKPEPLPASRGGSGSGSAKKGTTQIPGIGGPRARAKQPEAPAPASNGRKAPSASATAKAAAKADPKTLAAVEAATAPGDYDDAYERVKAAQRLKRRRTLR